jgi:hypothetical protein
MGVRFSISKACSTKSRLFFYFKHRREWMTHSASNLGFADDPLTLLTVRFDLYLLAKETQDGMCNTRL